MNPNTYSDEAAFCRAGLLLGLLRSEEVIRWADGVIDSETVAPPAFIDIAATHANELTLLRQRLLALCDEREPTGVVRALLGLVQLDLESGRRNIPDTMTVLKQLRAMVHVGPQLNEELKALGVAFALAQAGSPERIAAEQRVHAWLDQFAADAREFLGRVRRGWMSR